MPTLQMDITPELDSFIANKIQTGAYNNASEVVEAALAFLQREEWDDEARMEALIHAVDEGEASGMAEAGAFERVREARRLRRQQPVTLG